MFVDRATDAACNRENGRAPFHNETTFQTHHAPSMLAPTLFEPNDALMESAALLGFCPVRRRMVPPPMRPAPPAMKPARDNMRADLASSTAASYRCLSSRRQRAPAEQVRSISSFFERTRR